MLRTNGELSTFRCEQTRQGGADIFKTIAFTENNGTGWAVCRGGWGDSFNLVMCPIYTEWGQFSKTNEVVNIIIVSPIPTTPPPTHFQIPVKVVEFSFLNSESSKQHYIVAEISRFFSLWMHLAVNQHWLRYPSLTPNRHQASILTNIDEDYQRPIESQKDHSPLTLWEGEPLHLYRTLLV